MTNVSINLLLVKFRQQFGLRAFTEGFLVLYVLVTFFHLFVNDLSSAMMVRAAHGMVAAALSSLGIYYQVQAWPARHRLKADHRHHRLVAGHSHRAPVFHRTAAT
jgi:ABC-type transport system involved in cytochrome c biogenesis permease subunit